MKMMIINKDYSLLWCGQLASQLGNRIYLMALAWYFVAVLGNGSGLFMYQETDRQESSINIIKPTTKNKGI